jgi:hypothetical protein
MRRVLYVLKEMAHLVWRHKLYVIAPILLVLVLLVLLAFYLGPTAFMTFVYAGL